MKELKVISVNISTEKGTIKKPCKYVKIGRDGIVNDAHSGNWHRQISLLSKESIDEFALTNGREYLPGEFAENITLSGMKMNECRPGDIIEGKDIKLMITQIGKKCHGGGCAVFKESGACVMPKEGVFAKVVSTGEISEGETLRYIPHAFRIAVITLSNRASAGEYPDKSGPEIVNILNNFSHLIERECATVYRLIPDNAQLLKELIEEFSGENYNFIFTTGGTGVGPSDITPEVVRTLLDYEIPGIMEYIRVKYGTNMPAALLSRGVAGIKGDTFIFTLPGSVKAVNEYMNEITPLMEHLFYMRMGLDTH
ncbi:MAG: molybdenum cofactor synthesis domain-containing protein [Bacteroidales bacterium]